MLPKINPTTTKAWKDLSTHAVQMKEVRMKELFAEDQNRFDNYSHHFEDILIDFSKNIVKDETLQLLVSLANECKLKDAIEAMFEGDLINETEHRSVLHIALRNFSGKPVYSEGEDVMPEVKRVQQQMKLFCRKSTWRRMERLYGKENKIHCQYWNWWQRPGAFNGN